MANLQTNYLNLTLKNPIIVASSGLTKSIDKVKAAEDAGAGAVVVKSLFEEVLAQEDWGLSESIGFHTEAYDYLRSELEKQYGPKDYCAMLEDMKKKVDIPVIASINCVSSKWWPSFAKQIEAAGADALELNIFTTSTDVNTSCQELESLYLDIVSAVVEQTRLPVALKIGYYFTSLPHIARALCQRGAQGLVLFNRFTEPDIDIEKLSLTTTFHFTSPKDIHIPLRWLALLSGHVSCDLAGTTGVHDYAGIVKFLLAGASVVQIASEFYQKGLERINEMLTGLSDWMDEHNFSSIDEFRGELSFLNSAEPEQYLRTQFLQKIRGVE